MDPLPKMVIPTTLATRKGQLEAGTAEEIDELISSLIIAKAGLAAAAAAIAAASDAEAGRRDGAPRVPDAAEPASATVPGWELSGPGRWTATRLDGLELVVERLDDGMSFLPRAGAAVGPVCGGLLSAATWATEFVPAPVITDSERDCPEKNPASGFYCHRSGQHRIHRDSDGETWSTPAPAGPQWCAYRSEDGRACALPAHPADEPHADQDHLVIEPEPARSWQDDMAGRPAHGGGVMFPAGCDPDALATVTPLRPDHEVIPAALIACNEAHPSLGTLCTGRYPHPMPHRDPDGKTWVTEIAAAAVTS